MLLLLLLHLFVTKRLLLLQSSVNGKVAKPVLQSTNNKFATMPAGFQATSLNSHVRHRPGYNLPSRLYLVAYEQACLS